MWTTHRYNIKEDPIMSLYKMENNNLVKVSGGETQQ